MTKDECIEHEAERLRYILIDILDELSAGMDTITTVMLRYGACGVVMAAFSIMIDEFSGHGFGSMFVLASFGMLYLFEGRYQDHTILSRIYDEGKRHMEYLKHSDKRNPIAFAIIDEYVAALK